MNNEYPQGESFLAWLLLCVGLCLLVASMRDGFAQNLPNIHSIEMLNLIARVESNCSEKRYMIGDDARSHGRYQVQLSTARALGFNVNKKDLLNDFINESVARYYLLYLEEKYGDNKAKILFSYNAGEGKTAKYKKDFYKSKYVKKIINAMNNPCI